MEQPKLFISLYWHMHQPDYRDSLSGEYVLPWTYLHAIKDYTDMAHHLEVNDKARVNFNFVPVLLDQLEDYSAQFKTKNIKDPLLAMLACEDLAAISDAQCCLIVQSCFKSHHEKMLSPFPQYQKLLHIYQATEPVAASCGNELQYLSAQYKADLLMWYHLAWTGESVRRTSPVIKRLMEKGMQFNLQDRLDLFNLIGELITNLIPRYRALQESNRIEISTTPHHHPILPLLLDFKVVKDAMPGASLPATAHYPGGKLRARAHVESALASHETRFGHVPKGMWPAEGGVSKAALALMAEHGIQWAATGQAVLANSLAKSGLNAADKHDYLYKPYLVEENNHALLCFFRDDQLSDKIGFEYAKVHSIEAVSDFVRTLEHIQQYNTSTISPVVSVILDGENAWEYYPYNGYYFLEELYRALANHPDIEMKTFGDIVALHSNKQINAPKLPEIAAGSWVYGTFSTWIGSADKNLAWDLLCDAKSAYDQAIHKLDSTQQAACAHQLAICEGSDWFWWFGDYNSADSVSSFDQLYRMNLINLYKLLQKPVPDALHRPISVGAGAPAAGGTMRRGQA